ncbi:MAG: hypothetical protein F4052_02020, partial [Dehalococcoidia bacterium]|nr:hypothetical protein [Dehalococcoidia bacterium]
MMRSRSASPRASALRMAWTIASRVAIGGSSHRELANDARILGAGRNGCHKDATDSVDDVVTGQENRAMPHPDRIAIVGASLGGLRTAQTLRGRGKFEGTITLIGAEPHYPYDRPPLSKQVLAGEWGPERTLLDPPDKVDELGLDLRLGTRAEGLDLEAREVALSDGERVGFDSLIIATGATPRTLPNTPDLAGIYTLRTIDDSMRIRAELAQGPRVAVVG